MPATFFQRFVAYIADLLVLTLLYAVLMVVLGVDPEKSRWMELVSTACSIGYFTYFHARNGMTPGKALMRIQVLSVTGSIPSRLQAFLRYTPYAVFTALSAFAPFNPDATTHEPVIYFLALGYSFWIIVACYMIWMRPDRRTLHDFLAYTIVRQLPQQAQP